MSSVPNLYKGFLSKELDAEGSDTTIYVDRITNYLDETLATGDFSTLGRGVITVNPDGNGEDSFPEFVSFTGVSSDGFTGATRGLSGKSNTETTALKRYHPVGTPVVISLGFHNIQDVLDYVDAAVAAAVVGGALASVATAGETIAAGDFVYLKNDGKWWLADASASATAEGVQLGIVRFQPVRSRGRNYILSLRYRWRYFFIGWNSGESYWCSTFYNKYLF